MWQIIKAELGYNKLGLLITFLIAYAIYTIYLVDPVRTFPLFFFVFPLASVLFGGMKREKRERFFAVLPIPIKQRGMAGLILFMILYYIVMIPVWVVELFIDREGLVNEFNTHWELLSLIGVMLSLVIMFVIQGDLKFFHQKIYQWLARVSLLMFAALFVLIYFGWRIDTPIGDGVKMLFLDLPVGGILMNFICIPLLCLKILIYKNRISFLE